MARRSNLQRLTLPSLVGGVSTQPEGQRFPNQVTESVNTNLDMVKGLEKRDGTVLETVLANIDATDTVVSTHWFNRDSDELYLIVSTNNSSNPVRVFNVLDGGAECSVTVDAAVDLTYATGLNGLVTVSDTSFMFNSSVLVQTDPTEQTAYDRENTVKVADWSELTTPATVGEYRLAEDDYPGHPAGFYVSVSIDPEFLPQWERVRTPEADSAYDASTMPVRLRCTAKNTFTLDVPEWTARLSGDSATNPPATFVNQAITELSFWSGRLWIVAGQQLVGSRSNDILNFWVDDEVALNDADPIDLTVGSDVSLTIDHVLPYSNTMVVFTDANRQFELTSGASGLVSPATISLRESTAYPAATATPVRLGNLLYFPTNAGGASRLYEYILTDGSIPSAASDVMSHCFGYVPENVNRLLPISQSDQILMTCEGSSDIYLYQQRWAGIDKVQNAVCKWQILTEEDTLINMTSVGTDLYVLVKRGGANPSWRVEKLFTARSADDVNQDNFDYPVALDGKQLLQGVYDAATRTTSWTSALSGEDFEIGFLGAEWNAVPVYSRQAGTTTDVDKSGTTVALTQVDATTFTASGDWSAHPVILGRSFDMQVELSQMFVRDESGVPVDGTFQLKKMNVHHQNTGFIRVSVTPPGRDKRDMVYTAKQVGLFAFLSNEELIEGPGMFPVQVMSSSAGVKIEISSENPAPCNIPYIEIFGGFVPSKSSTTNYR